MRKIILIISAVMLMANVNAVTKKSYTVIFDASNGSQPMTQKLDSGNFTIQVPMPVKTDFVFQGWFRDTVKVDFTKPLSIDKDSVTFTAHWISVNDYYWQIVQPKVEELLFQKSNLKKWLFIAYGIAGLAILLAVAVFLLLWREKKKNRVMFLEKNNFRDSLLKELVNVEVGGRMDKWQKSLLAKIPQPASINNGNAGREVPSPTTPVFEQIGPYNKNANIPELPTRSKNGIIGTWKPAINNTATITYTFTPDAGQNATTATMKIEIVDNPMSLYADVITENGMFNRVTEQATGDSIFELKLEKASATKAKVTIYKAAEELVKQRPEFLEGCDVQGNGNTTLQIIQQGEAIKEGESWRMKKESLKVKIS